MQNPSYPFLNLVLKDREQQAENEDGSGYHVHEMIGEDLLNQVSAENSGNDGGRQPHHKEKGLQVVLHRFDKERECQDEQ